MYFRRVFDEENMSLDYDSIIRMLRANCAGPGNTVAGERVSPLEYLCDEYVSYSEELFQSENKELLETVIRLMASHEMHKITARPSYVSCESDVSAMCVLIVFSYVASRSATKSRAVQFINKYIHFSSANGVEHYSWKALRPRKNSCE